MSDPHGEYLQRKNFASLNGVRCLCCLAVIKEHVQWDLSWPRLIGAGWLGVDLFFCVSGFLIVTLLIRERERRGTVNLGKFYARRSLRIFPVYYLVILSVFFFYLAISPWRPNGLRYYLWSFPVLLLYAQDVLRIPFGGFFATWSLAMEEHFYLFWPIVEKLASRSWRLIILGVMLLINQCVNFGFFDGFIARVYRDPTSLRMPVYLITFTPILLGVLLAYLLHSRRSYALLYHVLGRRWAPFLFLAVLFAICEVSSDVSWGLARLMLHVTMMLLLGSLVIREDHFARPILTFAPIAHLGVISYGIYLYHVWLINLILLAAKPIHLDSMNAGCLFLLATAVTVAVAEFSFRFIEQPLLRIKERFHS